MSALHRYEFPSLGLSLEFLQEFITDLIKNCFIYLIRTFPVNLSTASAVNMFILYDLIPMNVHYTKFDEYEEARV